MAEMRTRTVFDETNAVLCGWLTGRVTQVTRFGLTDLFTSRWSDCP